MYDFLVQLKMQSSDDKYYNTDVADTRQLLRIIQSIPFPNAEPFKTWLAQVGYERVEETEDPEKTIDRAMQTYLAKGYSTAWINQRLKSIEVRKDLTDEWQQRGVHKGGEFAILTDEIAHVWSGHSVRDYEKLKGLRKENLRDNMTNLELVLNMLAGAATTEISKEKKPQDFDQNKTVARQGGAVARGARREIEGRTGSLQKTPATCWPEGMRKIRNRWTRGRMKGFHNETKGQPQCCLRQAAAAPSHRCEI